MHNPPEAQRSDHLGSPMTGTNAAGSVVWRESYTPFGEAWTSAAANDNQTGFTGHIDDTATGLTYVQARYYDPVIGRFLSIDPVNFTPDSPDMFNRYAYVANDPINMVDPNGEDSISVQFKDQKINWRAGIVIPQTVSGGHSGSVIVSNSGRTEYREYGRYGEQFDGDARGSVQTADVADLVFEGGVPTSDSLTGLFEDLLSHGAESGSSDLNLEFNLAADDFDGMLSEADRWDQDVTYSIAGKTCHDFCRAVTRAGGGRTGGQHSRNPDRNRFEQSLTPDNIDQAVENVRRQYEDRQ